MNGAPAATVSKAVRIHSLAGAAEQSAPGNSLINLSISIQNCNSLNLTTNVHSYELKLAAIKELNTDIIFLSDKQLVSNKGISGANRLRTSLRDSKGKKYDLFANSSANSRGVAILADSNLQLAPVRTYSDPEENFLFIKAKINGCAVLLGSIYGPNNTARDFYRRIKGIIQDNYDCKIIVGGDWNTVWDRNEINSNIDTFNMQSIPNKVNCNLLRNMCEDLSLLDPTRVLYPNSRIYTYSPFGNLRSNRSRLDFFVISENLLPALLACKPALVPTINLFDHNPVVLRLGQADLSGTKPPAKLRNSNLDNSYLRYSVLLAAYNCYLFGLQLEGEDNQDARLTVEQIRHTGGLINEKLKKTNGSKGNNSNWGFY